MSSINIFGKLRSCFNGYTLEAFNKKKRLINASPGPAQIPPRVIQSISNELAGNTSNFQCGNTPLEMSHRSPEFTKILMSLNKNMRSFMKIPDNFEILWTHGGGHGQFAAIPLNMRNLLKHNKAYYAVNSTWSNRAYEESKMFINSENILPEKSNKTHILEYNYIKPIDIARMEENSYLYICSNETVNGIEYQENKICYPDVDRIKNNKLIVDMSSDFLMKKAPWEKIDVAFSCSSKNMGTSGLNILVIRKDLLEHMSDNEVKKEIPSILNWQTYSETKSLYNTPAIFNLYVIDKLLQYYSSFGNIEYFDQQTKEKVT